MTKQSGEERLALQEGRNTDAWWPVGGRAAARARRAPYFSRLAGCLFIHSLRGAFALFHQPIHYGLEESFMFFFPSHVRVSGAEKARTLPVDIRQHTNVYP